MAQGTSNDSVFFYGFGQGDYGTQGPWIVGWGLYRQHLYYKGWWSGQNIVRYVNGALGPRSGLVNLGVTGLPVGLLSGLGYQPVSGKSGWCVVGTALYRFDAEATGSAATLIGNLALTPTRPLASVVVGAFTYITNFGDKTYQYDPVGGSLTAITNSPGGTCICNYLDRLLVGGTSTAGNIVWYSDPAPANGTSFTWKNASPRQVTDGVTTSGSTTLTSATAAFTSNDVGSALLASTIPAGTTIASVTNSTTVVLSEQASATATGIVVTVGVGNVPWQSQYFYVGDQWEVRSVNALRAGLAICKQDGSWWMLQGTPGVNDSLRKVWSGLSAGSIWPHRQAATPDGRIWDVPYGGDYPGMFDGARAEDIKYLSFMGGNFTDDSGTHVDVGAAGVFQPDEVFYVSGNPASPNTALLRRNGAFCKHLFAENVSGWVAQGNTGRMLLSDGGAVATAPVLYAWRASGVERPNISGNNLESVGDGSTTPMAASFTLPEWLERSGGQVQVNEVQVEFLSYNTGVVATNHFDLSVTATRRRRLPTGSAIPDRASNTYTYDEAGGASSASGTQQAILFNLGEQGRGNGFVLNLANLRGVAITRILVKVQTEPATV